MKEFSDLKAENINLKSRIVNLEKSSFGDSQHSRRGTIEIDGIPNNVGEEPEKLEGAVIKILKSIDVSCNPDDIEAVHRLPSKGVIKPTIIKFVSCKTAESAYRNKHKLKQIDGLKDDSAIYIQPSLSPYFKKLAYNCHLKRNKFIESTFTNDDGSIKIKTLQGRCKNLSCRFQDFTFYFD